MNYKTILFLFATLWCSHTILAQGDTIILNKKDQVEFGLKKKMYKAFDDVILTPDASKKIERFIKKGVDRLFKEGATSDKIELTYTNFDAYIAYIKSNRAEVYIEFDRSGGGDKMEKEIFGYEVNKKSFEKSASICPLWPFCD
jgi:hypothetical protein